MTAEIILDENPSKEDLKVIYSGLLQFNSDAYGAPENKQVVFLLRDSDSHETVGGLHAIWVYGWLYVTMLFIPVELRLQGLGRKLLAEAEAFARSQNSTGMWVDTFSFQAPGFYVRAGFEKFGELPNFPDGHSRIFYRKLLT